MTNKTFRIPVDFITNITLIQFKRDLIKKDTGNQIINLRHTLFN